jgi:hypothetical protein
MFIQREVGPYLVVIRSVSLQDTTQVRLVEHDYVIEAFATYRSDEVAKRLTRKPSATLSRSPRRLTPEVEIPSAPADRPLKTFFALTPKGWRCFPRVRKRTDSWIKAKRNRIPGCQSGKSV